jgi:hypothetical protein
VNHYLQRLALSAIKPGGTIHPILESVYSTRRHHSDGPWIEDHASVVDAPTDRAPVNPASPTSLQTAPVTEAEPSPGPVVEKIGSNVPELLLPRHSELSVHRAMEPGTLLSTSHAASALDGENIGIPLPMSKDKAEAMGQVTRRERSSDRRRPIVIPRLEPTTELSPSRRPEGLAPSRNPAPVVSGLNKTQPQAERFQRAKPEAREPDEIQIHIGRIEVTAVHPAPAPAAAKPQRNVPSLDEYLRRRDRRST